MATPSNVASGEVEDAAYVARPYQLELLYAAIDENTIVNLRTGAGKTFIAVMLIKHLSHQIMDPFPSPGAKRTVFLVNTVPLVQQQAGYITKHTNLKVGQYFGDMKVDSWSQRRWQLEFNQNNVVVMTRAIFKELLHRGFIHLRQVNLIVFDECHHAVKNDEYVQIMKVFDLCSTEEELPRVLGLSASLLPSKCKPGELEKKITALEETLRCRSQTAADLQEVSKYATNPTEEILTYRSSSNDANISELSKILEGTVNFLESFSKGQKIGSYDAVKLYLDDCLHILENLGVWCAHKFAREGLLALQRKIIERKSYYSDWDESLMHLGWTHLKLFVESSQYLATNVNGDVHVTSKVRVLLNHIETLIAKHELGGGDVGRKAMSSLLGIVFVERRTTAALMVDLIAQLCSENLLLKRIQCAYIVGHNDGKGGTYLRKEARMSVRKQNEALSKFRSGSINLLISTSVVEEGVDVPKCNLVVRFDFPQNFRSYIQSKGRARSKISTFLVLIEREHYGSIFSQLQEYKILENELQKLCHDRHIAREEEFLARVADLLAAYMPYGVEADTRATLGSSLSSLYRYCHSLPGDRYTILAPVFKTERRRMSELVLDPLADHLDPETTEIAYRSTLVMPMLCPLKEEIVGPLWMPTRRYAEKAAALLAIKKLHEAGELNEHLLPVPKDLSSDDESDGDDDTEGETIVARGSAETEKSKHQYPNKIASVLTDCCPLAGHGCHLYIMLITAVETGLIYQSLSDMGSQTALGLLTRKPLPHLNIPEFSIYDDVSELCVKVIKYHSVLTAISESDLDILKCCHKALFSEVLQINSKCLEESVFDSAEKNYLVVPLEIFPEIHPLEVCIDFDLAQKVASVEGTSAFQPVRWPCSHDVFYNALVTGTHNPRDQKLYLVLHVASRQDLQSPFPSPGYASFAEYFQKKYNIKFTDLSQPALVCKPQSESDSRLKLLTSRYKTSHGASLLKSDQRSRTEMLFPELCSVHILPANFWKLTRCLPSVLWRIESLLLVEELRSTIAREIGLVQGGSEVTTCTHLRGYEDHGFGNLKTQCYVTSGPGKQEVYVIQSTDTAAELLIRGPDNALLLQALTTTKAIDSVNLERLETLGDSFLKIATSVFLFCDRPNIQEGKLTSARSRRVGNLNLFRLANRKGTDITGRIFSTNFDPKQMWLPPGFKLKVASDVEASPNDQQLDLYYLSHRVTDKGVADTIESLIGAYLVSGGIEAAIKFMRWMGIKIFSKKESVARKKKPGADWKQGYSSNFKPAASPCLAPVSGQVKQRVSLPILVKSSSQIFSEYFGTAPVLCSTQTREVEQLLRLSTGQSDPMTFQEKIGWVFSNPLLLLQAFTHASFTSNRVTGCYQRLEILGDAILDYLVTCHIYSTFPKYGPGEISGMRSALVNNVMFAELAVKLELHKALLHNSPLLFSEIPKFVDALSNSQATPMAHSTGGNEELVAEETATITETRELPLSDIAMEVQEAEGYESDDDEVEELEPPKVLGDVLESLAGAVFLDSGMSLEAVWSVFQPHFDEKIKIFELTKIPIPPVHELYQLATDTKSKRQRSVLRPGYMMCTLSVPSKGIEVTAEATSYKAAKNAAAKEVLKKIKMFVF